MVELIWDGKYDKDGNKRAPVRVALPFQTVETVNESAQDRQRSLELFGAGREPEWRNRLIWGDKKYVLPSLLPEFSGRVDLIYIDPPFDTGADFSFTAKIPGVHGLGNFIKEPSMIEQKAYRDTWGRGLDSYLEWFCETAVLLRELLAGSGSLYVHLDWHVSGYAKAVLDEVFGEHCFRNEIAWKRQTAHSDALQGSQHYGRVHDVLLFYTGQDEGFTWNQMYTPLELSYVESHYTSVEDGTGRRFMWDNVTGPGGAAKGNPYYEVLGVRGYWRYSREKMQELVKAGRVAIPPGGKSPRQKRYLDESKGFPLQSVWTDIPAVNSQAAERCGYATQKPEALLERIMRVSSNPGDVVLDCFVGSGTTAVVAEKLGRRWIACDLGRFAIHTTRKRLLGIPNVRPFVVQNLGKYERQIWQAAEFPATSTNRAQEQRQREAAYRKFILDLYHATSASGYTWLHGVKGGRMVHVGAVDSPVTVSDVKAAAREVWMTAGTGARTSENAALDILGWEFAFELNETAKEIAAQARVDVRFKKIPRDVLDKRAAEAGDIHFFELGALSVEQKVNGRELKIKLADFVIPLDDVPEAARKAIKHWSQMIDYWAVDWDYKNDTFHNQWQSYRTRKDSSIELEAKYQFPEPGNYSVVVKVVDILGNDTTKALAVEIAAPKAKAKGA